MDRASAAEAVDWGSISGRVKPKTKKKLVFTVSPLDVQQLQGQCEAFAVCGGLVAALLEDRKVPSLSFDQGNMVNKM